MLVFSVGILVSLGSIILEQMKWKVHFFIYKQRCTEINSNTINGGHCYSCLRASPIKYSIFISISISVIKDRKSSFEGYSTQANSNPILHFPKNLLHISNIQHVASKIQVFLKFKFSYNIGHILRYCEFGRYEVYEI